MRARLSLSLVLITLLLPTGLTGQPMSGAEQRAFLQRYSFGLACHTLGYMCLTSLKDFRDSFQADIWSEVYASPMPAAVFAWTELAIAAVVLLVLAALAAVASPAHATLWMEALMCAGAALLVAAQLGSSWLFSQPGQMGGIVWSICTGTGIFLGYVPIGAMFYDRLIGALRCPGTAVFMINVSDSAGYVGTICLVLYKNYGSEGISYRDFFTTAAFWAGIGLCASNIAGALYWRREFSSLSQFVPLSVWPEEEYSSPTEERRPPSVPHDLEGEQAQLLESNEPMVDMLRCERP
eukprot:COSAG01_NODE_10329_length_2192_cov_1.258481_3_plen_294_part_00